MTDFLEQYRNTPFQRVTASFVKDGGPVAVSQFTQDLYGTFVLLNAQVVSGDVPCRLRLYSDETSRTTDVTRDATDFNIDPSVALIADIVLEDDNVLTFNPPIIGNTFSNGIVYYHLTGSSNALQINATAYPIGYQNNSIIDRSSLIISQSNVPSTGDGVSGSITTSKSFLILTGSATPAARLRLYSRPYIEIPASEQSRAFGTQPSDGSQLIADLMFDSSGFTYPLVPIIEGYTWKSTEYAVGTGEVGYILQNLSGGTANVTASLYIYTLED